MHYNNYICLIMLFMGVIGMLIFHVLIHIIKFHFLSSKSVIDHLFISAQLDNCVNKLCVINDIENQSGHLPLCMSITLPVCDIESNSTANLFLNRNGLWLIPEILQRYLPELDSVLKKL